MIQRSASGFVPWQATAQAVHGRGCAATAWRSARSQLQLTQRFLASNKNQAGSTVNNPLNFRPGFSAFSGVQPGLCLTDRSRGTSMLRMAAP
jgi:hypothetical protein